MFRPSILLDREGSGFLGIYIYIRWCVPLRWCMEVSPTILRRVRLESLESQVLETYFNQPLQWVLHFGFWIFPKDLGPSNGRGPNEPV